MNSLTTAAASTEVSNTNNKSIKKKDKNAPKINYPHKPIEDVIANIYMDLPFLGYIVASLKRQEDNSIPTAAISAANILYYNQEFINSLTLSQAKYVFFHEVLHRMNEHFIRFDQVFETRFGMTMSEFAKEKITIDKSQDRQVMRDALREHIKSNQEVQAFHTGFNIAADIAINQTCDKKFDRFGDGCFLDVFNKMLKTKGKPEMDADREWEYYLKHLMDNQDPKGGGKGKGQGKGSKGQSQGQGGGEPGDDDGEGGGEPGDGEGGLSDEHLDQIIDNILGECADGSSPKVANEQFKDTVRKGIDNQRKFESSRSIGKGSSFFDGIKMPDMSVKIRDNNLWQSVIMANFGKSRSSDKQVTLRKPSRRDENNPFGRIRIKRGYQNIVLVDTSGSIIDYVEKFMGVIQRGCLKYNSTCHIFLCTDTCYGDYNNVRFVEISKMRFESGGTDLTQAQKAIMKQYPTKTNVICLTDGYTDWIKYGSDWVHDTTFVYCPGGHHEVDGGQRFKSVTIDE